MSPYWVSQDGRHAVHHGDCLQVMRTLDENSVDSIVTDPPYGLEFMGKDWDAPWKASSKSALFGKRERSMPGWGSTRNANCTACGGRMRGAKRCSCDMPTWDENARDTFLAQMRLFQSWCEEWALEALRAIKPGGHLLAFGGTRTHHRVACAIEDAGWEIRDCIMWVYGSGFPKSHNLKGDWGGWGTALKPAYEPIIVARKPLVGTVAENVLRHGTGGINVDGCRVEFSSENDKASAKPQGRATSHDETSIGAKPNIGQSAERVEFKVNQSQLGRWPANLIHDGSKEVVGLFPNSNGSGPARTLNRGQRDDGWGMADEPGTLRDAGSGSAARFFYCAKASKSDRNEGLEAMPTVTADPYGQHRGRRMDNNDIRFDGKPPSQGKNNHPTVKPTALMRYLCRLVTPPDGIVLDPFMGSGSTGKAAVLEGFRFTGIELDEKEEYLQIAIARIIAAHESLIQSRTQQGVLF